MLYLYRSAGDLYLQPVVNSPSYSLGDLHISQRMSDIWSWRCVVFMPAAQICTTGCSRVYSVARLVKYLLSTESRSIWLPVLALIPGHPGGERLGSPYFYWQRVHTSKHLVSILKPGVMDISKFPEHSLPSACGSLDGCRDSQSVVSRWLFHVWQHEYFHSQPCSICRQNFNCNACEVCFCAWNFANAYVKRIK